MHSSERQLTDWINTEFELGSNENQIAIVREWHKRTSIFFFNFRLSEESENDKNKINLKLMNDNPSFGKGR